MYAESAPRAVIVAGRRTPFARAGGELADHDALDLSLHAVAGLLDASGVDPDAVEAVRWGSVVVDPRVPHLARDVVLRSALPNRARAVTVTDNCITGLSAVADLAMLISLNGAEVAIAGGAESMSNPALLFTRRATRRFLALSRARGLGERLTRLLTLRPGDFLPQPPAVAEPSTGRSMGQHCEEMVQQWCIDRQAQDALALRSHRQASAASDDGRLAEQIHPLEGLVRDPLIRADTSAERLAALRPVFDRSARGTITAGNSSPLTDGAAALLLMSESRAHTQGVAPLARVADWEFAGIDPARGLLMAPALAVPRLLARNRLRLDDLDLVEVHEAFAGQVLCNLAAWEQGWLEPAVGRVDPQRLNVMGSSIALGHPFAATGIRILACAAGEMARRGARRVLVSVCGAGATAAAMLLERT
jgi:acetyl-CoA acetyltransferase family protein